MSSRQTETGDSHVDMVGSYFDDHASEWSDLYLAAREVNDLVLARRKDLAIEFLSQRLTPGPGVRVLDAGCGAGLAALDLARRGFDVHGFDVSAKMLDHCRRHFEAEGIAEGRYEFTQTDLLDPEFSPARFDGIVALGFLQYLPDERAALRRLNDLLNDAGVLVITGPTTNKISNYFGFLRFMKKLKRELRGGRLHALLRRLKNGADQPAEDSHRVLREISVHTYSPGRFRRLLGECGFEMVAYRGHGFVGFPILRKRIGYKGELFLHRFFTGLSRVLPIGRWGNDLVVVAVKRS